MEAVPRLQMLSFPLKISPEGTSFSNLKKIISEYYQEEPETYSKEVYKLECLRNSAMRPEKNMEGCKILKRYYSQLHALENRIPEINDRGLFTFHWRDLNVNNVTETNDLRYEMAAVLYNIATLHTEIGATVQRDNLEGMKLACTHFQCAAWAFGELKDKFPNISTNQDFMTPELLIFMQQISFAQAQECILEKSLIDNRKPIIVARVVAQIINYYSTALVILLSGGDDGCVFSQVVENNILKMWKKYVKFKISYLSCILYLYQGQHSEEQQKMGERVALYQAAVDKLEEAKKESKGLPNQKEILESITFTADVVEGKRKNAKNENEFIYHEAVPEFSEITAVQGANLVNGTSFNVTDPDIFGEDIFSRLVPMKAHEASSLYSEEKAKILREIGAQIEEKDNELTAFMSSLNVDNLNISEEQANKIPQGIVDRCAQLNSKTNAIPDLITSMSNLAEICSDVETNLKMIKEILDEEDKKEKEYQQTSGVHRSNTHFNELSREFQKYSEAHNKAGESNDTLRKAMELHVNNLKILSKPLQEIQKCVPRLSGHVNEEIFKELKLILNKVNEMKAQRAQFHADLRLAINSDDITSKVITHGNSNLKEFFDKEISKHDHNVKLIEQNLTAQGNILTALTDSYAKCASSLKTLSDVKHKRETFFASLAASYDVYEDLLAKSAKGLEFYKKLQGNIQKLLTRIKAARDVQDEDRKQRIKSVTLSRTSANTSVPIISSLDTKKDVSSGPKLKDYLKDTGSSLRSLAHRKPLDNTNINMIPSIRPNPLGSENPATAVCITPNANVSNVPVSVIPNARLTDPPPPYSQGPIPISNYDNMGYLNPIYQSVNQNNGYFPPTYQQAMQTHQYPHNNNPQHGQQPGLQQNNFVPVVSQSVNSVMSGPHSSGVNVSQLNQQMNPLTNQQQTSSFGMQPTNLQLTASQFNSSFGPHQLNLQNPGSIQLGTQHQISNQGTYSLQPSHQNISQPVNTLVSNQPNCPNQNFTQNHLKQSYQSSPYLNQNVMSSNNNTISSAPNTNLSNDFNRLNIQNTPNQQSTVSNPLYGQAFSKTQLPMQPIPNIHSADNAKVINPMQSPNQTNFTSPQSNYSTPTENTQVQLNQSQINQQQQSFPVTSQQNISQSSIQQSQISSEKLQLNQNDRFNQSNIYQIQNQNVPIVSSYSGYSHPQNINQYSLANSGYLPINSNNPMSIPYTNTNQYGMTTNSNGPTNGSTNTGIYNQQIISQNNPVMQTQQTTSNPVLQSPNSLTYVQSNNNISTETTASSKGIQNTQDKSLAEQSQPNQPKITKPTKAKVSKPKFDLLTDSNDNQTASVIPGSVLQPILATMNQNKSTEKNTNNIPLTPVTTISQTNQKIDEIIKPQENEKQTQLSAPSPPYYSDNPITLSTTNRKSSVDNISLHSDLSSLDQNIDWDSLSIQSNDRISGTNEASNNDNSSTGGRRTSKSSTVIASNNSFDPFDDPKILKYFHKEVEHYEKIIDSLGTKMLNGNTPLYSKWKDLQDLLAKDELKRTTNVAKLFPEKNRSFDSIPYDHARVVLERSTDNYINAAYIKDLGPGCPTIILAQTPLQNTVNDFWSMIWTQKARTVVCLHTPNEILDTYWPQDDEKELHFDDFSVILVKKQNLSHCIEYNLKLSMNGADAILYLSVLQIKSWSKNVPANILDISRNILLTHQQRNTEYNTNSPLIINCLTGSERSGLITLTICAILSTKTKRPTLIDVVDIWYRICSQRKNALKDANNLELSMKIVLHLAHTLLNQRGIMTSYQVKIAQTTAINEKEEKKDPLRELDPLWKLKQDK